MTAATEDRADLIEATGRLAMYSLLATGLAFPSVERLRLLESRLLPAVAVLMFPNPIERVLGALAANLPGDVQTARDHHLVLFPPIASQDAPGYETGYRGDGIFQQTGLMADIAGFYRAHGLRAGGEEKERPDHITVELEFMAVLARKEAWALREGVVENALICRDTSVLFLSEHVACWAPAFGRRISTISASPWFRNLGQLVALWTEYDLTGLGAVPVEIVEGPLPQDELDDGSCGPCPTPPSGPTL